MAKTSLSEAALSVLNAAEPALKTAAAHRLKELWTNSEITLAECDDYSHIGPPDTPGRPMRPELVDPRDVKRRRLGSVEGRISLLHAIAHIEFNAIDLAADMIARFYQDPRIDDQNRFDFVTDWITVCDDEARHFKMIEDRLIELGSGYGQMPAHNGLWEAALSTKDNLAARLVVAPMVLEARGLDVTPKMIANLQKFGDAPSADLLTIILDEEIAHIAAGARWFNHICENENRPKSAYFRELLATHFKGVLRPPFNNEARKKAGLSRSFYEPQHQHS